ncbi:Thiamine-monophosphate kinase [Candidatus Norongarragalina meridionalis]|nr:Thiamine-monophosphate kinase [Candidatus Norongarragalina meridionalis]
MLSERDIIDVIKRSLGAPSSFEDAEELKGGAVCTTDMVLDFDDFPKGTKPYYKGWTAVCSSVSDLAAAGAKPLGVVASWAIPRRMGRREIAEIARGMRDCAKAAKTRVIGGDVNESERLILCTAAAGDKRRASRSGAKPGDIIAVTGRLGASAAGWLALKKGLRGHTAVKNKFMKPPVRINEMQKIVGYVDAATDLSDGLLIGIYNICEESRCGAEITGVPIDNGVEAVARALRKTPFDLACIGSDYELLLAIPKQKIAEAKKRTRLYEIGVFTKGKGVRMNGKVLQRRGFQHFQ